MRTLDRGGRWEGGGPGRTRRQGDASVATAAAVAVAGTPEAGAPRDEALPHQTASRDDFRVRQLIANIPAVSDRFYDADAAKGREVL